jgi:hypothetical protein
LDVDRPLQGDVLYPVGLQPILREEALKVEAKKKSVSEK